MGSRVVLFSHGLRRRSCLAWPQLPDSATTTAIRVDGRLGTPIVRRSQVVVGAGASRRILRLLPGRSAGTTRCVGRRATTTAATEKILVRVLRWRAAGPGWVQALSRPLVWGRIWLRECVAEFLEFTTFLLIRFSIYFKFVDTRSVLILLFCLYLQIVLKI